MKEQVAGLESLGSTTLSLHVGAITYFRGNELNFYWCDPAPRKGEGFEIRFNSDVWGYYYSPLIETIRFLAPQAFRERVGAELKLEGVDVEVSIHPAVAEFLFDEQWERAQRAAVEATTEIAKAGYQPDGLLIKAGTSWSEPFTEPGARE